MREPFNWSGWLEKVPGWAKAAFGLIGVIAAFIVAFRENWYLYSTVTVVLILIYILGVSLYILLKRQPSKSRKKKWIYQFEKQRPWALPVLVLPALSR